MKGVKYNLKFKKPDLTELVVSDVLMKDLIKNINTLLKQHYNISSDMYNINNQIIYNLLNNRGINKLIKNIICVEKC